MTADVCGLAFSVGGGKARKLGVVVAWRGLKSGIDEVAPHQHDRGCDLVRRGGRACALTFVDGDVDAQVEILRADLEVAYRFANDAALSNCDDAEVLAGCLYIEVVGHSDIVITRRIEEPNAGRFTFSGWLGC
ncbi:MAG: hypothetical protein H6512_08640 [Acidimicrobiia bacterium]|nr:hypothetical protein [Acidimicrobiia bacterium]